METSLLTALPDWQDGLVQNTDWYGGDLISDRLVTVDPTRAPAKVTAYCLLRLSLHPEKPD
jgi:hypothetical protein